MSTEHLQDETEDEPKRRDETGMYTALANEVHIGKVASEVRARAGEGSLHFKVRGISQEVLYRDRRNGDLAARLRGELARLSDSTTDPCSDVIIECHGNVIERIQVKDAPTYFGAKEVKRQAATGKYDGASLAATPETVKEYVAQGGQQVKPMESTGISSDTSTRVAREAGSKVVRPAQQWPVRMRVARDLAKVSAKSAAVSAAATMTVGTIAAVDEVKSGAAVTDAVKVVVVDSIAAGASSGAKSMTALAVRQGALAVGEKVGREGLKQVVRHSAATTVIFAGVDQAWETVAMKRGKVSRAEYVERSAANVGGSAGAAMGAALGSILPGPGTLLGGMAGGIVGAKAASTVTAWARRRRGQADSTAAAPVPDAQQNTWLVLPEPEGVTPFTLPNPNGVIRLELPAPAQRKLSAGD